MARWSKRGAAAIPVSRPHSEPAPCSPASVALPRPHGEEPRAARRLEQRKPGLPDLRTLKVRSRVNPRSAGRPAVAIRCRPHPSRRIASRCPQRLCLLSSALPFSVVPQHGVENGEKLPRHCDESHFLRLACGQQPLVEDLESRVVSTGGQGGNEQRRS